MFETFRRWMPIAAATLISVSMQVYLLRWAERRARHEGQPGRTYLYRTVFALSLLWLVLGGMAGTNRFWWLFPPTVGTWLHASAWMWMVATVSPFLYVWLAGSEAPVIGGRRSFLNFARHAVVLTPAVVTGYGTFIERTRLDVQEIDIAVPGLPKDLENLRIAQISDIHLGPFLTRHELRHAVEALNELRPNLTVVTGDLISKRGDPLEDCVAELKHLRADAGVLGCMGNHERYAKAEARAEELGALAGIQFLRGAAQPLRFGTAILNVAGVDYQAMHRPYLPGGEKLKAAGAVNLLLSHNPDVFERAAQLGFDVTLAGHTHGGQVNVEILEENFNLARFYTRYVSGLYALDGRSIYVNRGIGTIGLPVRLGAPPEVSVIRLCAA